VSHNNFTTAPRRIQNSLLRMLSPPNLSRIVENAERIELPLKHVLHAPDDAFRHVHFIESGTVSMISTLDDGHRTEVGLIGPEGMVGLSLVLGAPTAALEALVQVGGVALRLSASNFRRILSDMPDLLSLLLRYVDSFHAQVVYTAACNGHHLIEQRLARWLLMTHDRVCGDSFPMRQEFLSTMLGVNRPGVSLAVGTLHRAGLVSHAKGVFKVIDRPGLEAVACECYMHALRRFDWLRHPPKV
jgi:CRP-like cAMP-binding protein